MVRTRYPRPSVVDFTKLLSVVVKMKQYSLALSLLDEMLQRNAPVNHCTLGIAVDCFCRLKRVDYGFAIMGIHIKRGYELNVIIFNNIIKGIFLVGKVSKAGYWNSIAATASPVLKLTTRSLIVYARTEWSMMLSNSSLRCLMRAYCPMIQGLCNFSRWKEVEDLLKNMVARKISPNVVTCNILADAYCKEGRVEEGEHILDIMKQLDVKPDIFTYCTLIDGYCLHGEMDEARRILDLAVELGLKPDRWINEAWCLFLQIPAKGLQPNVFSYNTMLHGLFSDDRCEDGLKLFIEMESRQLSPNIRSYNILLEVLCRARRIGEAFSILHMMEDKGVIPDIVTYSILIEGLCNDNKIEAAKDLLNKLPSKGLQPNVVTFSILIGALSREGPIQEAKDLLMHMASKGCLPNGVTYNVFVQGLVKRNEIVNAIPLLEEMNAKGFVLDASTFSLLIEHLEAEGRDSLLFHKVKKLIPKDI